MERVVPEAIALLQFLLPGFLAAWVFYAFTSYRKPSEFERIIQALIFTLLVKAGLTGIRAMLMLLGRRVAVGHWTSDVRHFGITRETSFPSEWFGAFLKNITYVVLQLKDERRIYGWPMDWPSTPNMGYFTIREPSWLDGENQIPIKGVSCVLINSQDVRWVEFLEKTWEKSNVNEKIQSASSDSSHDEAESGSD
jgi:hypothetical protein